MQRAISAQQVYGDTQQLVIPTPDSEEMKTVPSLVRNNFKQPKQYIHVQGNTSRICCCLVQSNWEYNYSRLCCNTNIRMSRGHFIGWFPYNGSRLLDRWDISWWIESWSLRWNLVPDLSWSLWIAQLLKSVSMWSLNHCDHFWWWNDLICNGGL